MDHDHSYKLLFSHREMMADLLRGFVAAEWVRTVDSPRSSECRAARSVTICATVKMISSGVCGGRVAGSIFTCWWSSVDGLPLHGGPAHDLCGPAL